MNNRLSVLTNKYVDEELTPDEQKELDNLLLDVENKKYFESFVKSIDILELNKVAKQQVEMKNTVMNKINNLPETGVQERVIKLLKRNFGGAKIGYALSFAFGVLFAAVIFLLQMNDLQSDDQFMKGTIANLEFNRSYQMNETFLNGAINVEYSYEMIILDVDLKTNEPIDAKLNFDKNQFSVFGIKNLPKNESGGFTTGANSVTLSDLGANHYLVFLKSRKKESGIIDTRFFKGYQNISNVKVDINY